MISAALMEKFPTGKCTSSGLQVLAMPTTVEDVPDDCMELIMERLALVDHYKGWWSLIQPYSLRASPFSRDWLLIESKVGCESCATRGFENGLDSPDLPGKHDYYFSLLFYDPVQGKAQAIVVNLEGLITTRDCEYRNISRPVLETDKGLILVNVYQHVRSINENRHDRFLVLNPINNTKSFLPPIPSRLCRCKLFQCDCKAIPLKLTVNMGEKGVLKGPLSSSYKAYVLERKDLPKRFRRNSQPESLKYNFRVTVYDSMTQFWARTGAEWIGTSLHTQIFPMRDGTFYVSAGGDSTPCYNSIHHILYKFQDGILVGKVKAPAKVKANHNCDFDVCLHSWDSCGCISATVFESKGKIFFFQQKSWVGLFGPNCISAIVWELNDKEMVWVKLHVLHPQKFQFCSRLQNEMNIMLRYEGILLVFRGQKYTSYEHPTSEFCCVAGFDTFKKTWCKVPESLLETLSRPFQQGHSMTESMKVGQKFHFYGESLIFEPRVTTRA